MDNITVHGRDRDIAFYGELIGEATSYVEGKQRWAEVRLYRTDTGAYVVAGVGRSTLPGETDWRWAEVCPSAEYAVDKLHVHDRANDEFYMPPTNRIALENAIVRDSGLREAYAMADAG